MGDPAPAIEWLARRARRGTIGTTTEMASLVLYAAEALARAGAATLTGHDQMPWGCRIVAEDPDGRAIEVNRRGHCPG